MFNIFDIVYINLKTNGHCQGGERPVVIVQNEDGNRFSPTLIVIPLTSKIKKLYQPTHGLIKANKSNGLKVDSMLLAEQIMTINKESVIKKIGTINNPYDVEIVKNCFLANLFGKQKVKVVSE